MFEKKTEEEECSQYVELWQDKMRRLEAHGEEFKLAPVFKINAPRMFMAVPGRAESELNMQHQEDS